MPGNFDWVLDIINFTLFGAKYFLLINICKFPCGTQLGYLEIIQFLLTFQDSLGRTGAAFILKLIIPLY